MMLRNLRQVYERTRHPTGVPPIQAIDTAGVDRIDEEQEHARERGEGGRRWANRNRRRFGEIMKEAEADGRRRRNAGRGIPPVVRYRRPGGGVGPLTESLRQGMRSEPDVAAAVQGNLIPNDVLEFLTH